MLREKDRCTRRDWLMLVRQSKTSLLGAWDSIAVHLHQKFNYFACCFGCHFHGLCSVFQHPRDLLLIYRMQPEYAR